MGFVDLHRHLDGSLRYPTLVELAAQSGSQVPAQAELVFRPNMGLGAALERFAITLAALQSPAAVKRVASEMCEDAETEGVTTLEIRFAPQLHRGAALEEIVDAVAEGVANRAGIILCGLYGESPEVVMTLAELAVAHPAVVGIDLAGSTASGDTFQLRDYAPAFQRAMEGGVGRTVHAGEGRPVQEIRDAIELLRANRIGHGCTLLDDTAVLDLVLEREVTIEACPSSNVHTGAIASIAEHPLPRWLELGVRACVCTDNTLLSSVDTPAELEHARSIPGMNASKIAQTIAFGQGARFRRPDPSAS